MMYIDKRSRKLSKHGRCYALTVPEWFRLGNPDEEKFRAIALGDCLVYVPDKGHPMAHLLWVVYQFLLFLANKDKDIWKPVALEFNKALHLWMNKHPGGKATIEAKLGSEKSG